MSPPVNPSNLVLLPLGLLQSNLDNDFLNSYNLFLVRLYNDSTVFRTQIGVKIKNISDNVHVHKKRYKNDIIKTCLIIKDTIKNVHLLLKLV